MTIAKVYVTLKNGILDPEGSTVRSALRNLGMKAVEDVRMGKVIQLRFGDITEAEATKLTEEACRKLLANPVIEEYRIEVERKAAAAA